MKVIKVIYFTFMGRWAGRENGCSSDRKTGTMAKQHSEKGGVVLGDRGVITGHRLGIQNLTV